MNRRERLSNLTDQELVVLIQEEQDYLGEVYKRTQMYSINFMRTMTNSSIKNYELEDVYQDAILVLYEKLATGNFELISSLQTYLNSVCRYQLLNKFKNDSKFTSYEDYHGNEDDENSRFDKTITDELDKIDDPKETQFVAIEKALEAIKAAGGHCYELLTLFWYQRKSMNDLTAHFGYNNSDTTKNQKAKCQKRLKQLSFNILQS